jgi:hypothetical protein
MCSERDLGQGVMRQRFPVVTCIFALLICGTFLCPESTGQNAPPPLQEQLKAQYKLVKTGADANGLTVVDPGTVLDVQKGGLLGVAPQNAVVCPSKFQDGDLKGPNGFCAAMVKQYSRYLQVGEKVYPLKIDVSLDKDKVSIQVIECDSCNGVQQPSFYKSEVVFQFAKGALRNTSVPQVEDTISKVLAINSGGDSQDNNQGAQNQDNGQGGGQGQQQGPPPEPQQIEKGQTPEQVKATLGNPDKIVTLGATQIYIYKDIKVTFLNGKVADVQ